MKKTLHILSCAAVAIVALASCAKEQFKENTIPTGEKIQVSVNGQIGDFIPADATKADAASVVRVSWAEDDEVYVYDGTDASIDTLTVTPDPKNASQALLSGEITPKASPAPSKLTLVYVKGATEAPDITGGKISIDLSKQDGKDVPFVLYATIDYNAQKLEKSNEYVPFKFATSVMTVNCTGLQTGSENAVIGISKAEIEGVSTVCELAVTGSGVTVAGAKTGKITRTDTAEPSVFTQSDSRGSFKLALAADPAAPAARNILVHQGSKVSGAPFTTATLAGGKSYNTVYQLSEYALTSPDDALPGKFSVNSKGKQVYFSQGNLYYDGSAFKFETNQYDYHNYDSNNNTWGLFGWSTSTSGTETTNNYGMSTSTGSEPYIGYFYDWGKAYCKSNDIDDEGTWFTMTGGENGEWAYLLDNHIHVWGNCNDVPGLFIAPDGFEGDATALSTAINNWETANVSGIVFLPAAGERSGQKLDDAGNIGYYWSASPDGDNSAYFEGLTSDGFAPRDRSQHRTHGHCVRLVTTASSYAPAVKVTGVTMGKEETSITVGKKETLVAIVAPANAANKQINWLSSNTSVATVGATSGEVTGVAPGSAVITATTADGNFTAVCLVTVKTLPVVALKGEFSVSDTNKVRFSKGNLYAKNEGSTESPDWKWHFYDEQYKYNYLSTSSSRTANANDTEIDLFTWGYDNTSTNTSYSLNPENTTGITGHDTEDNKQLNPSTGGDDWGVAYCESNSIDVGTWRTLSTAEWQYLFSYDGRSNGGQNYDNDFRRGKYKTGVKVCGKENCVVLLPDNWDGTVISLTNFAAQNTYDESSNPKWSEMEAAGAVCLPAAGYRSGSSVDYDDGIDSYWSSTAYQGGFAYYVCISSSGFSLGNSAPRSYGFSVRLITDVK